MYRDSHLVGFGSLHSEPSPFAAFWFSRALPPQEKFFDYSERIAWILETICEKSWYCTINVDLTQMTILVRIPGHKGPLCSAQSARLLRSDTYHRTKNFGREGIFTWLTVCTFVFSVLWDQKARRPICNKPGLEGLAPRVTEKATSTLSSDFSTRAKVSLGQGRHQ